MYNKNAYDFILTHKQSYFFLPPSASEEASNLSFHLHWDPRVTRAGLDPFSLGGCAPVLPCDPSGILKTGAVVASGNKGKLRRSSPRSTTGQEGVAEYASTRADSKEGCLKFTVFLVPQSL